MHSDPTPTLVKEDIFSHLPIQLHGSLYYAYKKATGWKMLSAAYRPQKIKSYTIALWGLTIALCVVPFSNFLWGELTAAFATAILFLGYYFLANYTISRGLQEEYKRYAIADEGKMQPRRLIRDLMHYHWFHEKVIGSLKPNKKQVEQCIEFIDSNKRLPITNTFSRHPMVVLAVGIPAFAINQKIPDLFMKIGNIGLTFFILCYCVSVVLYIAWIFHSSLYDGERDDWRFKRYLTWYSLQEFSEEKILPEDHL